MRTLIAPFLVFTAAVAGCAKEGPAPTSVTSPVTERQAAEQGEAGPVPCAGGHGFDQLPNGLCLGGHFSLVDARDYAAADGNARRRLTFGYRSVAQIDLVESVAGALVAAGYRRREGQTKDNGALWVPFTKEGQGTTYLEVLPPGDSQDDEGQFFLDFLSETP